MKSIRFREYDDYSSTATASASASDAREQVPVVEGQVMLNAGGAFTSTRHHQEGEEEEEEEEDQHKQQRKEPHRYRECILPLPPSPKRTARQQRPLSKRGIQTNDHKNNNNNNNNNNKINTTTAAATAAATTTATTNENDKKNKKDTNINKSDDYDNDNDNYNNKVMHLSWKTIMDKDSKNSDGDWYFQKEIDVNTNRHRNRNANQQSDYNTRTATSTTTTATTAISTNTLTSNTTDSGSTHSRKGGRMIFDLHSLFIMKNEWKHKIVQVIKDLFLPIGYPNSVNDGYIQYQFYDSIQALCSYLVGVVSTSAVLSAAGVGDSEATALSAAVHWATKDGCGMIGGLVFSYYSSSNFDSHVKEFRLFADIINDIGLAFDMITPIVPKSYLIYVSIAATVCRSLCGIAARATKGSITQHFARGNMADLNAKEGTQETLVSLIGMGFGIVLARMIQSMEKQCNVLQGTSSLSSLSSSSLLSLFYGYSSIIATWYIFLSLTLTHVWANYKGVKILRLRTLNRQRAETALSNIIQKGVQLVKEDMHKIKSDTIAMKMKLVEFTKENDDDAIISPSKCNESIWKSVQMVLFPGKIRLGVRLSSCLQFMTREEILTIIGTLFKNEKYFLIINEKGSSSSSITTVNVVLRMGASEEDELKGFVHAMIVKDCMEQKLPGSKDLRIQLITRSKNCVDLIFNTGNLSVEKLVSIGWEKKLLLGFGRSRAAWNDVKVERTSFVHATTNESK